MANSTQNGGLAGGLEIRGPMEPAYESILTPDALAFEGTDLLTQRGLLDSEAFRGPGNVPFLGDGDEIAKVT